MEGQFWKGKRVVVTGGSGFLGSALVDRLKRVGADDVIVPRRRQYDLVRETDVDRMYRDLRPDVLFHLAATVGGIGANRENPGRFLYENAIMGLHVIHYGHLYGTGKLVVAGTICAYPKFTPVPFREEDLWNGYPEETNAPYGLAKKLLLVQCQAYRQQYGTNAIYLLPVNLYGPRDNFDPASSHVIPALIRKFVEAKERGEEEVVVWGTGTATREFLYVDDAAVGMELAARRYDGEEPVNLGMGAEISIRDLAELIGRLTGYEGRLTFDPTKPDGQPRRQLDTRRAADRFGFRARTRLEDGLRATIAWYLQQRESTAGTGAVRPAAPSPA